MNLKIIQVISSFFGLMFILVGLSLTMEYSSINLGFVTIFLIIITFEIAFMELKENDNQRTYTKNL